VYLAWFILLLVLVIRRVGWFCVVGFVLVLILWWWCRYSFFCFGWCVFGHLVCLISNMSGQDQRNEMVVRGAPDWRRLNFNGGEE